MRQRETMTLGQLGGDRSVHFRMGIPQDVRHQALDVVDVLIPVHVPNPTSLSALEEDRGDTRHVLARPLAECLGAGGDDLQRADEPLLRLRQRAVRYWSGSGLLKERREIRFVAY